MDRVRVLAAEVTLSGATNLSKATAVRVVNDTNATIVLTIDDGPVATVRQVVIVSMLHWVHVLLASKEAVLCILRKMHSKPSMVLVLSALR